MRTASQILLTFVLNAVWQIALVAIVAQVCVGLLSWTRASVRHAIWVAALVISVSWPMAGALEVAGKLFGSSEQIVAVTGTFVDESKNVLPAEFDSAPVAASPSPSKPSPIHINGVVAQALAGLYLLFVAFRSVKLFRAWVKTRTILKGVDAIRPEEPIQELISECQKNTGVTRVRLVSSAAVPVPITAGWFHPLIVIPQYLLAENDPDVLASAIGHELIHVARRDYVFNLLFEFLYLPVAFHPAAALLRRRIKQTRELCCDELVARKLLKPEVYARSLVRLIGSVSVNRQLPANTTIGITEADILEVRIMSLLNKSKLSTRRRVLTLATALLLSRHV